MTGRIDLTGAFTSQVVRGPVVAPGAFQYRGDPMALTLRLGEEAVLTVEGFEAPTFDTGDKGVLEVTVSGGKVVVRGREIGHGTIVATGGDPKEPSAHAQLDVYVVPADWQAQRDATPVIRAQVRKVVA